MKNVYQIGSGELTFDIIEQIISENLKLELAPEARRRIQTCRDYLDAKIAASSGGARTPGSANLKAGAGCSPAPSQSMLRLQRGGQGE